MVVMSSWAGIESGPVSPTDSRPVPRAAETSTSDISDISATSADGRDHEPAVPRRLRRQQRPVIGSLDGAGVLLQRNARELVLGSALIILPGVVINLIATSLAFDRYQSFKRSVVSVPELLGGQPAATGIEELLAYLGLVVNSLAACLVGGYVATLVVRSQIGLPPTIRSGYRALSKRILALVTAWAIGHCWIVFAGLLLARVSGGGLASLIILGAPVIFVLATMTVVVSPAIVVERLGPIKGLRRAWRMARASFSTLFGYVCASILIGVVVQYGIAYLPRLLQQTGLVGFGRFAWLIEGAAGQLGRLISMPLVAIATTLVYLETRMTIEGMDLVLDADRAFGR